MPGISYNLDLDASAFRAGAAQSIDYINQLHARIDKLGSAGGGAAAGGGFLSGLSETLFKLPQQVMAVAGLLGMLALPSSLAASAETTSVAFRTLIGDAELAEKTLSRISDLANKSPFGGDELTQAARMLVAFGEAADSVPETLRRLGDVASGTGVAIGELAELYGKARVAGTLFTEDINEMTGRGIPIIREFANILGVSQSAVKNLASEGKIGFAELEQAFSNMTSPGGQFSGMMETLSGTMEGLLSSLADARDSLLQGVGAGMNDALKPLVAGLTEKVSGLAETGKKVGDAIGQGIDMAVVTFQDGSLVGLLGAGLKAAAFTFADTMMDAADLVGERLKAKLLVAAAYLDPRASDADRQEAEANMADADNRNMRSVGVGSIDLENDKRKAQKELAEQFSSFQAKTAARKQGRVDADEKAQADRKQAAEDVRVEAASKQYRDKVWRQQNRDVQMDSLAEAKATGAPQERIDQMKADFLQSARENNVPGSEIKQMRADFGMKPVMEDAEARTGARAGWKPSPTPSGTGGPPPRSRK
ncbi:MAG: tape measure protein [Verrucomicrobiota bacterium]